MSPDICVPQWRIMMILLKERMRKLGSHPDNVVSLRQSQLDRSGRSRKTEKNWGTHFQKGQVCSNPFITESYCMLVQPGAHPVLCSIGSAM